MTGRGFIAGAAVALAWAGAMEPGAAQERASPARRVAGCYETHVGSWTPSLPIGGDTVYMIPPARVRLWNQLAPGRGRDSAFAITPLGPPRSRAHKFGLYRVVNRDSIEVTFSNGLSGVTVALGARHDSLVGVATSFWDFPRPSQSATALFVKKRCPSAETGRPQMPWTNSSTH
jgi:hypothetical protein